MIINDALFQDSIKTANNFFGHNSEIGDAKNVWMWLAITELIVIFYLLFIKQKRNLKKNERMKFKDDSLKENIDFENILKSSFNSIPLYDELKVKCHPDRFTTDEAKCIIADSIFQEITMNKTNYKKLIELKEEAREKLNINF